MEDKMVIQEFVHMKEKEEQLKEALSGLNKKRQDIKGKESFCDDGIKIGCGASQWLLKSEAKNGYPKATNIIALKKCPKCYNELLD